MSSEVASSGALGRAAVAIAGIPVVVLVLLFGREREVVGLFDEAGVALDERGECEILAAVTHEAVELVEVEALVLQCVRELVHDGDTCDDIVDVGAADDHALRPVAVEAGDRRGVEVLVGADEVDVTFDETEGAELARVVLGRGALRLGGLVVVAVAVEQLQELLVGEEVDGNRVLELQSPFLLDEPHVLDDAGVPVALLRERVAAAGLGADAGAGAGRRP